MPPKSRSQKKAQIDEEVVDQPQKKELKGAKKQTLEVEEPELEKAPKLVQVQKKLKIVGKGGEDIEEVGLTKMKTHKGDGTFDKKDITIASWNVNGIRAMLAKEGFLNYFKESKMDIICLNEVKIDEETYLKLNLASKFPKEYFQYFNCSKPPKTGYSGVAIFSKYKPLNIRYDIGVKKHDQEGRTLTLEFDKFFLVSCYVPNSGQKLDRLGYRTKEWDKDFSIYMNGLKEQKPAILCGDLNVAHNDIDLYKTKGMEKYAGFTPEERQSFGGFLKDGWVDSFRNLHPTEQKFTYFSARSNARQTNSGWRLDYFVINEVNKDAISHSDMNLAVFGSDHIPIEITLDVSKL